MTGYQGDAYDVLTLLAEHTTTRYRVILIDPPWDYAARVQRIRKQYALMRQSAIRDLPIGKLAAPDSALFCWVTMPQLGNALEAMAAWGFTFKTNGFTWIKLNRDGSPFRGTGSVTRSNAELCLFGYRGKPIVKYNCMSSVIMTQRRQHSRKPDEVYGRIEALYDGPYLEVFARQCWPGWDCIGNQVSKFTAQPLLLGEQYGPQVGRNRTPLARRASNGHNLQHTHEEQDLWRRPGL